MGRILFFPRGNGFGEMDMGTDGIVDYFGIEMLLSEEEKRFRDKVRKFVDEECMPIIAGHF